MRKFILTVILLVLYSSASAANRLKWDTVFLPGDKVCIYDIGKDDPLADKSPTSLKYYYRSPLGDQRSRYELRPSVTKLLLQVVWPGLKIENHKDGYAWFSGTLFVIKGGYGPDAEFDASTEKGANKLVLHKNRSWVMNSQLLYFKQVRLKKKRLMRSCHKKQEVF